MELVVRVGLDEHAGQAELVLHIGLIVEQLLRLFNLRFGQSGLEPLLIGGEW